VVSEYARGDFALAELAQALGKTPDADALHLRAHSYQALYDSKAGFLRGRGADGTFPWMSYAPETYTNDYVEANGWQSLWMNDHDLAGLATLVGGTQSFVDRLSALFDSSRSEYDSQDHTSPTQGADRPTYYWQGNEPDIHYPFLFAQLGHPELTARWVRFLMQTQYSDHADGLPGNDDGGTMSAWYVFAAIGIYPLVGSDRYVLSIPQFPKIELGVSSGDKSGTLTIEAVTAAGDPAPPELLQNGYVQSVTLNQMPLAKPELRHRDLTPGSTLRFVLGSQALAWGQP
jgi:predicted alpha-1,2-mannosidase